MTGSLIRNNGGSGGMGGGTVTSVDVDGGATGLTTSGGPVIGAGVIILDGTVNIAHGGTGATTAPAALAALGGQIAIQFKDEGVNLGTAGTVDTIDFVGAPITVTRVGNAVTVGVMAGAGTVTSVDADGGVTGLTFGGGPITTAGVLTLGGVLAIGSGGTGATTAPAALVNLGAGTVNSVDVSAGTTGLTATGGPITNSGVITLAGTLNIANGGTGAMNAAAARTNLNAQIGTQYQDEGVNLGTSGTVDVINFVGGAVTTSRVGNTVTVSVPSGPAGTVTSVDGSGGTTGMTLTGGPITTTGTLTLGGTLAVSNGGTGSTTASGARTNLSAQLSLQFQDENVNLGTTGTADTVNFTGAGVTAIRAGNTIVVDVATNGTVSSVDVSGGSTGLTTSGGPITSTGVITLAGVLDVDNGGTGAITPSGARTNLGAQVNIQYQDEGVNLGATGTVDTVNFVGSGVATTRVGNTITATIATNGTVTSVNGSGGTTGLTLTGGPITTTGTLTLGGTLAVTNGGTGATTATAARTNLAAAPLSSSYVVIATDAELTNERSLSNEVGVISLTDNGAGSTVVVGVATNGISNTKIRTSNALSVIGRSANSIGNVADIQTTAGGNKVLRETGSTLAFSNWIGSDSTQSTLAATYTITASGAYQNTGLSINLDAMSTYLIIQQVRAIANVALLSAGGAIFTRLFDVTNAAAISNTELLATFSGALNTDSQQSGAGFTILTTGAAAPTIRLEAQRSSGPTWTTSNILSSTTGRTRIIAVKIGSA